MNLPSHVPTYIPKQEPSCFRFAWQSTALACFLTRASAGMSIDIKSAMMAITTSNSTSVKALFVFISCSPVCSYGKLYRLCFQVSMFYFPLSIRLNSAFFRCKTGHKSRFSIFYDAQRSLCVRKNFDFFAIFCCFIGIFCILGVFMMIFFNI